MTAIRDRRSDAEATEHAKDAADPPWKTRSVVNSRRGMPWWSAALLTFGLTLIGAFADQFTTDSLSVIFYASFIMSAVGAVLAVQRKSLFGPMVQPPLAMGLAVPLAVLTASGLPEGSDLLSKALAIGTPLINAFPVMAGTTVATLLLGVLRIVKQRAPDAADKGKTAKGDQKPSPAPHAAAKEERRAGAARDKPQPPRRVPEEAADKGEPPQERRPARPRPPVAGGAAPRRERPDGERKQAPREGERPPRRRPAPPENADPRRRGEGRAQPPAGRGRRVPPPPRANEPPRGEHPPRKRQPGADPRRGGPRGEPPRGDPRGGRPRGDNPPRGRRPWDDDRR